MGPLDPSLLIGLISAAALLLIPATSRLIADVGAEISEDVERGPAALDTEMARLAAGDFEQ